MDSTVAYDSHALSFACVHQSEYLSGFRVNEVHGRTGKYSRMGTYLTYAYTGKIHARTGKTHGFDHAGCLVLRTNLSNSGLTNICQFTGIEGMHKDPHGYLER